MTQFSKQALFVHWLSFLAKKTDDLQIVRRGLQVLSKMVTHVEAKSEKITLELGRILAQHMESSDQAIRQHALRAISELSKHGGQHLNILVELGLIKPLQTLAKTQSEQNPLKMSEADLEILRSAVTAIAYSVQTEGAESRRTEDVKLLTSLVSFADVVVQRYAAGGIVEACKTESGRQIVTSNKGIESLVDLVAKSKDSQALCFAANALSRLATDKSRKSGSILSKLESSGAAKVLATLSRNESPSVQKAAASGFQSFASNERTMRLLASPESLAALADLFLSSQADLYTPAAATLADLSSRNIDKAAGKLLELSGVMERAVFLLADKDSGVRQSSLRLISGLMRSEDAIDKAVSEGIITRLAQIAARPADVSSQKAALEILTVLADDRDAQVQIAYGNGGRVLALLLALSANSPDKEVRANAAGAIVHLTSSGLPKVIVSQSKEALRTIFELGRSPDVTVRRAMTATIRNIAENLECSLRLAQAGAYRYLLDLARSGEDPLSRQRALCAFAYLSLNNQLHQHINEGDNLKVLMQLAQSSDQTMQRFAVLSICNIASSESTHEIMRKAKVTEFLATTMRSTVDIYLKNVSEGALVNLQKKGNPIVFGVELPV
mmetsp:Transcript_43530/g.70649  ORF Transcript_43530/g.70649 Transcript_43530/m.70649 type:complete len:613 (-) Transcript_43530:623-2461(-)